MATHSFLTVFLRLNLFLLSLFWLQMRCDSDVHKIEHRHGQHTDMQQPSVANGNLNGDSVYYLDSEWSDQYSRRIGIGELKGKPQILALIYTSCEAVCPLIVGDMKRIEKRIASEKRQQVSFVLVSFDPERDKPRVLKEYGSQNALSNWTLLSGDPEDVRELAAVLGVRYRAEGAGQFSHSNTISILDANGVLRHQQIGLNQDPTKTLEVLDAFLR